MRLSFKSAPTEFEISNLKSIIRPKKLKPTNRLVNLYITCFDVVSFVFKDLMFLLVLTNIFLN